MLISSSSCHQAVLSLLSPLYEAVHTCLSDLDDIGAPVDHALHAVGQRGAVRLGVQRALALVDIRP